MDISQLLQFLKGLGSAKSLNKTFDFCGKFLGISDAKSMEQLGVRREVSEAFFVDAKGGRVTVSVWDLIDAPKSSRRRRGRGRRLQRHSG